MLQQYLESHLHHFAPLQTHSYDSFIEFKEFSILLENFGGISGFFQHVAQYFTIRYNMLQQDIAEILTEFDGIAKKFQKLF